MPFNIKAPKISNRIAFGALDEGDAQTKLKTAMYVLKISGLQGYANPGKLMTKEELEKEMIISAIEIATRQMGIIK
jgi:hypothetical protein